MNKIFVLLGEDGYDPGAQVDGVFFNENDLFERIKYIISDYEYDKYLRDLNRKYYSDFYTVHITNGDKIENIMEIDFCHKKCYLYLPGCKCISKDLKI